LWYAPGIASDLIWWSNGDRTFFNVDLKIDEVYTAIVGDFDGDGNDDIFWYGPGDEPDLIWWSNGDRTFTDADVDVPDTAIPIAADFDGDGSDDIFWYGQGAASDVIWWANGDGTFTLDDTDVSESAQPISGDFDGDGNADIFWYGAGAETDSIWWSNGDRTFTAADTDVSDTVEPISADFDGDGNDDIFWYGKGSAADSIWWSNGDRTFTAADTDVPGTYRVASGDFDGDDKDDIFWYGPGTTSCSTPSYYPEYWNNSTTILYNNNCYNYANNHRTDTFAQPGLAAGAMYSNITCGAVSTAATADGLTKMSTTGYCPPSQTTVALVVWPGVDYHWYRLDINGMWTHKMGGTEASNLDNSGDPIYDPQFADRGSYVNFCGYMCICSDVEQGKGHEIIN
jgi:hypothetical protein